MPHELLPGVAKRPRRSAVRIKSLLQLLAQEYPVFASDLKVSANRIARILNPVLETDLQIIMAALTVAGCNTVDDISNETKIPSATVQKRLKLLIEEKLVYRTRQVTGIKDGSGGNHRTFLYWPTNKSL